ncbi:hypothetical protein Misp01_26960 [Microtetraspora sp. NBRC 13810]|uniref:hypothetical protein n=1 Tax=Microtetraspora sp. NBRC 13810 TaxID=3030990 RepID=UPI0024A404F3|nr:hypothetical protein [Microtetraspora sp. NBRC 13810]GLW07566.1 hypothetical protein Misp01_26960 [Microtetraspora sp. NBRC 13810]
MELPAQLQEVYKMVEPDAPWPGSEEDDRQRFARAGGFLDASAGVQKTTALADPAAAHVRLAGNTGQDVDAFDESWGNEGVSKELQALGNGTAQAGIATFIEVVWRNIWKYIVMYACLSLLVSFILAFMSGPAAMSLVREARTLATRKGLRAALELVRKHIGDLAVGTMSRAARNMVGMPVLISPGVVHAADIGAGDNDPFMQEATEAVLKETPEGREALAWAKEHNVSVLYQKRSHTEGEDSTYDPYLNSILLNTGFSASDPFAPSPGHNSPHGLAERFIGEVANAKTRTEQLNTDGPLETLLYAPFTASMFR